MWMMGCNESCEFNMWDSFNSSRKLRPLVPRPMTSSSNNNTTSITSSPHHCLGLRHGSDLFSLNHPLAAATDQSIRRESNNTQSQVMVSSRWNPTPEQLRTLEELYRRGTRTPSADQIQHITAQLRKYGKIEGKNVFYWFQNHKARERQKRRRQIMEAAPPDHHHHHHHHHHDQEQHPGTHDIDIFDRKDSGPNRTGYEGEEHTKNWPPSTIRSTTLLESKSMNRTGAAKAAVTDQCRPNGWSQLDEEELQQQHRRSFIMERNATWQPIMNLSCPSPTNHLINATADTTITTTMTATTPTVTATTSSSTLLDHNLFKSHDLNYIFIAPQMREDELGLNNVKNINSTQINEDQDYAQDDVDGDYDDHDCADSQTLQLFPLHDGDCKDYSEASGTSFIPSYKFFEFLPLKN